MRKTCDYGIDMRDRGEHNTMVDVEVRMVYMMPKDKEQFDQYLDDAKKILDKESKELNPIGIGSLMGALEILVGDNYTGKHNRHPTSKMVEKENLFKKIKEKCAKYIAGFKKSGA